MLQFSLPTQEELFGKNASLFSFKLSDDTWRDLAASRLKNMSFVFQ